MASANVSTNPPAYPSGASELSQTPSGGLRVQAQDGAGNDVNSLNPLPVTVVGTVVPGSASPADYSNRSDWFDIAQGTTGTAATTLLAAGTGGVKFFVTDVEIANAGTNSIDVLLNNSGNVVLPAPAAGGTVKTQAIPFQWAANTAIVFTPSGSPGGTLTVGVQGFKGS